MSESSSDGSDRVRPVGRMLTCALCLPLFLLVLAVLFPSLAKPRDGCLRNTCQTNLKRQMVAMLAYAQDWDGRWPTSLGPAPWPALGPYLAGIELLACPADRRPPSYVANPYLAAREPGRHLQADRLAIHEGGHWGLVDSPHGRSWREGHARYGNFAFADGHVKGLAEERCGSLRWDLARPRR